MTSNDELRKLAEAALKNPFGFTRYNWDAALTPERVIALLDENAASGRDALYVLNGIVAKQRDQLRVENERLRESLNVIGLSSDELNGVAAGSIARHTLASVGKNQ